MSDREVSINELEHTRNSLAEIGLSIEDLKRKSVLDIHGGQSTFEDAVLGKTVDGEPINYLGATLISEFNPFTEETDGDIPHRDEKFDMITITNGFYTNPIEEDMSEIFRVLKEGGQISIRLDIDGYEPVAGEAWDDFRHNLYLQGLNAEVAGFGPTEKHPHRKPYLVVTKLKEPLVQ